MLQTVFTAMLFLFMITTALFYLPDFLGQIIIKIMNSLNNDQK